jgi:hypothetical protein
MTSTTRRSTSRSGVADTSVATTARCTSTSSTPKRCLRSYDAIRRYVTEPAHMPAAHRA